MTNPSVSSFRGIARELFTKFGIQQGWNTIRFRLLVVFLFFTFIIIFMSGISAYYLLEVEKVMGFNGRLQNIKNSSLQLVHQDLEALNVEFINPLFYETGTSSALTRRWNHYQEIDDALARIDAEIPGLGKDGFPAVADIRSKLKAYSDTFALILVQQRIRGFKSFGLEGEMRRHAHELETHEAVLNLDKVLSLRRHEKDFFLRNDPVYIQQLNGLASMIQEELHAESEENRQVASLLTKYVDTFNELVQVQQEIGLKDQTGLKRSLNNAQLLLSENFHAVSEQSQARTSAIIQQIKLQYAITCLICIGLSFLFSFLISASIGNPIRRLSDFMGRFILNHIHDRKAEHLPVETEDAPYEMEHLASSFAKMTRQLRVQYREISDKKKALEAKNSELVKLNEDLDRFVYSVSHDLRAPLTSMLGLIDLARLDLNDQALPSYLEMMRGSVQKMDDFILDILNFSRNKSQEMNHEIVDLEKLMRDSFKHNCFSVDQLLDFSCQVDAPVAMYSDLQRLRMIFNNLISNAIRYQDFGKDRSYLSIRIQVNANRAYIEVEDNGIGIGAEYLGSIFKRFYRASYSSKGSGLGLYIVQEVVQKLNGNIHVASMLGKGSVFTVEVPNLLQEKNRGSRKILKKNLAQVPMD